MLNIVIVAQAGRIGYQAVLCAASIRVFHPKSEVRIVIAVPSHSAQWSFDPSVSDAGAIEAFRRYDCELVAFDNADFGSAYPHANKFYAIATLPPDEPFLFLDSDSVLAATISESDLSMARPSLKRAGPNWPVPNADGRTIGDIWRSLYEFFALDAAPQRDPVRGDTEYQCFPYYNGGIVYHSRAGPLAAHWLEMSKRIWLERPACVNGQALKPWLDQIVLPLVFARLGVPPGNEPPDRIHKTVVHYHFPFYLQVRHKNAIQLFNELSRDERLMSVLRNDEGFRYYMSDEAKAIVRETYEAWKADKRGGHQAFLDDLRPRVPLMR